MGVNEIQQIIRVLRAGKSFLVVSHPNPDGDAIGSMLGVYHLLRGLGKDSIVCMNDDPVPRVYSWLNGADVFVRPCDLGRSFDTVIMVDIARKSRLGKTATMLPSSAKMIVVDHHPEDAPDGDFVYVDTASSAVGEILFEFFENAGIPLTREAAECLYVSIATDTGGFRYANTTAAAHRIAAALIGAGVDVAAVSARIFETMSMPKMALLRRVLDRMQHDPKKHIAYTIVYAKDAQAAHAENEDFDGLVNYARNLDGIEVGILFREMGPMKTKVSLRSRGAFDCSRFLRAFGGGGHVGASGATLDMSLNDARKLILEQIKEYDF